MKSIKIISLIIFTTSFISSQDLGIDFNVGYSKWKMEQVNDYLDNSESVNYGGFYSIENEDKSIGQPVSFELGASARLSQFILRISGNYMSTNGSWESYDTVRSINHDIDVSTLELIVSVGYNIPIYKTASILLEGGIGYGFASSDINYLTRESYSYPFQALENMKYDLSGSYFVGRLRGGLEAQLKWLVLRFVFGYSFSNPVVLKGESLINGVKQENQPVILSNGDELEFDFSGICYAWGITVLL